MNIILQLLYILTIKKYTLSNFILMNTKLQPFPRKYNTAAALRVNLSLTASMLC